MVSRRIQQFVALSAWLFLALFLGACGDRATPTSPDANFSSNSNAVTQGSSGLATPAAAPIDTSSTDSNWQTSSSGSGGGGTVKETLVGPAINGVTPSGLATADQSKFSSGGSTILTVQVKNVNLPSGTVLGVTLDFTPVGSITLSGGQGSTTANLGHFAVSRDQVRVNRGNTTILQGGFFQ